MKLLVLQIGDIHLTSTDDDVMSRADRIVAAVRNLEYQLDLCILCLTGDIADTGADNEYLAALALFTKLREGLGAELQGTVPVKFAAVPGNHDCDLSSTLEARQLLLDSLQTREPAHVDESMVELCTEVQRSFFTFRDTVQGGDGIPVGGKLHYEYDFSVGSETVAIRCCNTAWVSQLRERPGTLYFPIDAIGPLNASKPSAVITMFHHPYNWLQPGNARSFRRRIEEVSDIILTGHEHSIDRREQTGARGERNLYLEGGALQERGVKDESAFNAIVLDTTTKRQRVFSFAWDGDLYRAEQAEWEEFLVNRLKSTQGFELSEAMSGRLDDLGISLGHPARGPLRLGDIFVHPDLREISYKVKEVPRTIHGEDLAELLAKEGRLLITGPDRAGKTCLAKRLFREIHEKGFVPVLLNASELKGGDEEALDRAITKAFKEQYGAARVAHYEQLERQKRVLLLDDYHRLPPQKTAQAKVLGHLTKFAGQVALFANDLAQELAEIIASGQIGKGIRTFSHYGILPFGHVRRNELAEKWFALDPLVAESEEVFARKLVDVKRMMDTAIGRNFVPAYPVFVLSILQAQEHNEQVDLNASTYGYFYELLIRRALAIGSTRETFDVKLGYLAFLAYAMFDAKLEAITEPDFRTVHARYESQYSLSIAFAHMQRELLKCQILEGSDELFWFKYKYIYYYFVASYLRDHITDSDTQGRIAQLAQRLFDEDSANILLFLAHLSKHPFIIQQLLKTAQGVFADSPRAELRAEDSPTPDLDKSISDVLYLERDARSTRRDRMRRLDDIEEEGERRVALERDIEGARIHLAQMGAGFRTLQILGQILKNFPGSIEAKEKRLITEECYNIGLRFLGSFFALLHSSRVELIRSLIETLRIEFPDIEDAEIVRKAQESVFGLTFLASYGAVQRVAESVGSPHLFRVYEAIRAESPSPAVSLIHMSLQLNEMAAFPTRDVERLGGEFGDNPICSRILKSLVVNHFHLFEVRFDVKQRVCDRLGISYRRLQKVDPRKRLLGPKEGN